MTILSFVIGAGVAVVPASYFMGGLSSEVASLKEKTNKLEERADEKLKEIAQSADEQKQNLERLGKAALDQLAAAKLAAEQVVTSAKEQLDAHFRQLIAPSGSTTPPQSPAAAKLPGPTAVGMTPTIDVPIGTVLAFAGPINRVPEHWQICDGRAMQVSQYPELYRVLGTLWGGTTDTYFNLPNLSGAFLRGVDPDGLVDRDRKAAGIAGIPGTKQEAGTAMPKGDNRFKTRPAGAHTHGYESVRPASPANWQSGGSEKPGGRVETVARTTQSSGEHTHEIVGGDSETRPVNFAVVYIIRIR